MVGKRDRGEPHFMVMWNSSLEMFKYVHVYSHYSTIHVKTIAFEGSLSSTARGKKQTIHDQEGIDRVERGLLSKGEKGEDILG